MGFRSFKLTERTHPRRFVRLLTAPSRLSKFLNPVWIIHLIEISWSDFTESSRFGAACHCFVRFLPLKLPAINSFLGLLGVQISALSSVFVLRSTVWTHIVSVAPHTALWWSGHRSHRGSNFFYRGTETSYFFCALRSFPSL